MSPVLSSSSLSHTLVDLSVAAKRFLEDFGDRTDLPGESLVSPMTVCATLTTFGSDHTKKFVVECMSLPKATDGQSSPTTSPNLSDLSGPTLVSQERHSTLVDEWMLSRAERRSYYNGIAPEGHHPELLYRSNSKVDPWVLPQGRFTNLATKSARSAHGTRLAAVWGDVLRPIDAILFAAIHKSYSIDAARFFTIPGGQEDDAGFLGPAVVWVTVDPALNVSSDTAHRVSEEILALLREHDAGDAIVEWCEGVMFRLTGPRVLPTILAASATAQVRRHLTAILNLPIAPAEMEAVDRQGSTGLLFHESKTKNGRDSDKVLVVTNHHVVCKDDAKLYDFRAPSSSRPKIRLCSNRRFQRGLTEIQEAISRHGQYASVIADTIRGAENKDGDEPDPRALRTIRQTMENHLADILELEAFHKEVVANWSDIRRRDIGVLVYSPPISIEPVTGYTKDFAIVELDAARFRESFRGNEVWLGAFDSPSLILITSSNRKQKTPLSGDSFAPDVLNDMMNPRRDGSTNFKYPGNGRLRIRGCITKAELANTSLEFVVLKDGTVTDLTIGRCAGLESATRATDGALSIEIAVYNYSQMNRAFSRRGDSGSLIFDGKGDGKGGQGRMVALLHSGKANLHTGETYVTYGTPMWQVQEWIHDIYPHAVYTNEKW